MRFLHTADWQIGMKAAHVGSVGERVRAERLHAAERVVELAIRHEAEFILVAGDTFEDNAVDRLLVQRVAEILGKFPRNVYLLSGNHDPLGPGSVWEHPVWSRHPRIVIPRTTDPIPLPGGMLFPAPLKEKYSTHDPTAHINARECTEIAIGLAHGTVQLSEQDVVDYPIPRNAANRAGLDYLAIGHWHSFATFPGNDGVPRLVYSGTHETTKFGERDSGNALLVEIAERGAPPQITSLKTGGLTWRVLESTIREAADLTTICELLEAVPEPQKCLFDIRLSGVLAPAGQQELERLQALQVKFCYARIDLSNLFPSPQDEAWLDELPAGVLRQTAEELRRFAEPAAVRPTGVTAEVATAALVDLYRYWRETQR